MKKFSDLGIKPATQGFVGDKIDIDRIINREITVTGFRVVDSNFKGKGGYDKRLDLQIVLDGNTRLTWAGSKVLVEMILRIPTTDFPFTTTIIKDNNRYEFS